MEGRGAEETYRAALSSFLQLSGRAAIRQLDIALSHGYIGSRLNSISGGESALPRPLPGLVAEA